VFTAALRALFDLFAKSIVSEYSFASTSTKNVSCQRIDTSVSLAASLELARAFQSRIRFLQLVAMLVALEFMS